MILYRLLFLPLFLIVIPYYGYRMWKRGGYGKTFKNRLGFYPDIQPKKKKKRLWIQAVSVGEWQAVQNLLQDLHNDGWDIFVSTTTSTAFTLVEKKCTEMGWQFGAFPFDFGRAVAKHGKR